MVKNLIWIWMLSVAVFSIPAHSRVYKNSSVGKYKAAFDLNKFSGMTFLTFMQTQVFPALNAQAEKQSAAEHIEGVMRGEGVEVRLAADVSTYHVKYKAYGEDRAERSGRSFSAVGRGAKIAYVADASYKHYLSTLGALVKGDAEDVRKFYTTVIQIVANSDASGVAELSEAGKQVLADFVAVYVAEQYRHMIGGSGEGDLGKKHNWDDAHLQVTLLAAFHGGQETPAMYYEGKFTNQVYNQITKISEDEQACVYKQFSDPVRRSLKKRVTNLTDYWQFNAECERSGVNLTRADFKRMGDAISAWHATRNPALAKQMKAIFGPSAANAFSAIAGFFVSNEAPSEIPARKMTQLTKTVVDYLMQSYNEAPEITVAIAKAR